MASCNSRKLLGSAAKAVLKLPVSKPSRSSIALSISEIAVLLFLRSSLSRASIQESIFSEASSTAFWYRKISSVTSANNSASLSNKSIFCPKSPLKPSSWSAFSAIYFPRFWKLSSETSASMGFISEKDFIASSGFICVFRAFSRDKPSFIFSFSVFNKRATLLSTSSSSHSIIEEIFTLSSVDNLFSLAKLLIKSIPYCPLLL